MVVSNFVKTTNLTTDDQLAIFTNGEYTTWTLRQNGTAGPKYWEKNEKAFKVDADGKLTQLGVVVCRKCLAGSHHDTLSRVDTQWVEVFHACYSEAVVVLITDNLKLDLLPTLQRLLYKDLL